MQKQFLKIKLHKMISNLIKLQSLRVKLYRIIVWNEIHFRGYLRGVSLV